MTNTILVIQYQNGNLQIKKIKYDKLDSRTIIRQKQSDKCNIKNNNSNRISSMNCDKCNGKDSMACGKYNLTN